MINQANNPRFENLHIFDVANNHEGKVELGNKIIDAMGNIARRHNLRAGVKLQYRNLDTFIHTDYKDRQDVKHIPRLLANRLSWDEFGQLANRIKSQGLQLVITPFDEESVPHALDHGVDILKVASCSASDWPLLEKVAEASKPVLASTAGLTIKEIDDLVSFFTHRNIELALMHCVALYPTPSDKVHLNFMERMARRYPKVQVGYSGHEAPDNVDVGKAAVSKGARLLERHVGIAEAGKELNAYSMNPEEAENWVKETLLVRQITGSPNKEYDDAETESLQSLKRGVFAGRAIKQGELLGREDVFFAMPAQSGQLTSGEFGRYRMVYKASQDYGSNQPIYEEPQEDVISEMRSIVHDAKGMLHEAQVVLGDEVDIELSHHFGIEKFRQVGAILVSVINREYCKKLMVMLPGQKHPNHMHKMKEETFQLLWGDMTVNLEGRDIKLKPGDKLLIERGKYHSFATESGAVVEEISTTATRSDSYYEDPSITALDPMERKTILEEW